MPLLCRPPASERQVVHVSPHNPLLKHLLSLPTLLRVCIFTLVVAWRCTTKAGPEKPLGLASALWTNWLDSCNCPWVRTVGRWECYLANGSAMLAKFVKPSSFITPLHVGGMRPLWLPEPSLPGPCPREVTKSYSGCWKSGPGVWILEWVPAGTFSGTAQNPVCVATAPLSAHLPWLYCRNWLLLEHCPGIETLLSHLPA